MFVCMWVYVCMYVLMVIYSFILLCNYKFKYPLPRRKLNLSRKPEGNVKYTFTRTKKERTLKQDYQNTRRTMKCKITKLRTKFKSVIGAF